MNAGPVMLPVASQMVKDVACTLCGCVCDDLRIHLQEGRVVEADRACPLARPWFLNLQSRQPYPCQFLPAGRADRTLIVVDSQASMEVSRTGMEADRMISVEAGRDFEALTALMTLIRGQDLPVQADLSMAREDLYDLARRLRECRCSVMFFGLGLRLDIGLRLNVIGLASWLSNVITE